MVKIIMMLVCGLVLFGASAAASWFLRPASEPVTEETATNEDGTGAVSITAQENPVGLPPVDFDAAPESISAETVLRLSESIKRREKQLQEREKTVAEQESRLKFMIDDLQRERQEISTMMQEVTAKSEQARSMLENISQYAPVSAVNPGTGKEEVAAPNEAPAPAATEQEIQGLKTVAKLLAEMPIDQAAELIRGMSNNGQMDMAAQLLLFLEESKAAKLLGAIGDNTLASQLIDRIRQLKQPARSK